MYRVLGYWTVYCTQSRGVHIFSKHKSNMYNFVQPRGVSIFPLKHKSAMYTFVQQRGVGSEGTQITKVCTNVHTCMYICHLAPPPAGERVETFHISQIDERKCLGYQNIVIHCGSMTSGTIPQVDKCRTLSRQK